jgi:hypothetical protein
LGERDAAIAFCYELPPGRDGLAEALAAQRSLTALLRQHQATTAESIPIFVATNRAGESVDDCASAWGATEVKG